MVLILPNLLYSSCNFNKGITPRHGRRYACHLIIIILLLLLIIIIITIIITIAAAAAAFDSLPHTCIVTVMEINQVCSMKNGRLKCGCTHQRTCQKRENGY